MKLVHPCYLVSEPTSEYTWEMFTNELEFE